MQGIIYDQSKRIRAVSAWNGRPPPTDEGERNLDPARARTRKEMFIVLQRKRFRQLLSRIAVIIFARIVCPIR